MVHRLQDECKRSLQQEKTDNGVKSENKTIKIHVLGVGTVYCMCALALVQLSRV